MSGLTVEAARALLGVGPDATIDDIKSARRARALLFHPDRVAGAPDALRQVADVQMRAVNEAFDVLMAAARAARPKGTAPPPEQPSRRQERPPPPPPRPGVDAECTVCGAAQRVPDDDPVYGCSTCRAPLFRTSCEGCRSAVLVWNVGSWRCSCGRLNTNREVVAR